ncbi:MAG: hypothetical protein RIR18_516 [Pseudomonadota bacterium]|jgi:putative nucleotidyltransferase with HDIG domain
MTESVSQAKLLFVDDEPSILSALRRLFRPQGYQIFTAESGAEGLEILQKEEINLVLSDMRMPEMDGVAFLKAVKEHSPGTIRILLTGYADFNSTVAAINEGGVYRYVAKPWVDTEIISLVQDALEHQHLKLENVRLLALVQQQNDTLKTLNSGLEQKVQERTAELRQALAFVENTHAELKKSFLMTVQVFAGLIELRSGQASGSLAGHGRRVADHAKRLAKKLGMGEVESHNVMLAALLHDIGKLGLPDGLLDKPFNQLSGEHRALVMKHPLVGQNILMGIERLKEAAKLVRHHHESYDGSGYPDNLAGLAIPKGSRIICVANEYDALQIGTLVQRSLKASESLDFLIENRGKRYDPAVVDAFVSIMAETQGAAAVKELPLRTMHLKPGMVLSRDLMHRDGYMLLIHGSVLNSEIISQLIKIEQAEDVHVSVYIRQGQ